jgi:PAS domain S-box-containing protein
MTLDAPSGPLDETNTDAGLIDAVGCGIWLYDGADILFVNEALARITGYTRDELLAPQFFQNLIHPDDRDMIVARGQARVRGEPVPADYDLSIITRDGRRVWLHIHASLVRYKGRECSLVSALDISERREAEAAVQFLADVSAELGASLDYNDTLGRITRLAVPYLGDYAVMDIVNDAGRLERIAGAHRDPELQQLMDRNMPDSGQFVAGHPIYDTVMTGRSSVIDGEVPARIAVDNAHFTTLRQLNPSTYIVVPLPAGHGPILGAMSFGLSRTLPPWHLNLVVTTAEEVGRRAAHAIEQAKLFERASRAAEHAAYNWHVLDAMFAAAPIAMVFLDRDLRIVNINHVAARKSVPVAEHIGKHPRDVMPAHWELVGPLYETVLASGTPVLEAEHSQTHPKTGITTTWVSSYYPVFGDNRTLLGVAGVGVDITSRKAFESELQRANTAKDELLGLVSHELRTPLTNVLGNAVALRRHGHKLSPEDHAAALDDIAASAARLQRLIENMLVLSHVEARSGVTTEPILLQRTLPALVQEHRARHPAALLELVLHRDLPPVLAQPTYLEQIVQNLLSNAEKYAPAGEIVELLALAGPREVRIGVLDRGAGIPHSELESVFDPFYRSPGTAATTPGAGLGLAVCRRLAEVQDGNMWAECREGGGAAVWFSLPRADTPT